jgi:hypothetical protein
VLSAAPWRLRLRKVGKDGKALILLAKEWSTVCLELGPQHEPGNRRLGRKWRIGRTPPTVITPDWRPIRRRKGYRFLGRPPQLEVLSHVVRRQPGSAAPAVGSTARFRHVETFLVVM